MSDGPLRIEFGRYTEWILEAADATGVSEPIAIACRGTGDPALFADLAEGIRARAGMRVLDLGCGMGGPGSWLRSARDCDVIGFDLMFENVRAATRLLPESRGTVATTTALPFATRSFDALWAVGVLEMIEDKALALKEASRVLRADGRAAVYTFTTTEKAQLVDPPASNHFVSPELVQALAEDAGLEVAGARVARIPPAVPARWVALRTAVAEEIARRHGGDPDYEAVRTELARFARLRSTGAVVPWRFDLIKRGD
ncbi:MAG TPA: class I SAM-dependent methyltransferase [Actinomycetota bacterium]